MVALLDPNQAGADGIFRRLRDRNDDLACGRERMRGSIWSKQLYNLGAVSKSKTFPPKVGPSPYDSEGDDKKRQAQ